MNLILWETRQPSFRPLRTLQFAPISFDVHFQVPKLIDHPTCGLASEMAPPLTPISDLHLQPQTPHQFQELFTSWSTGGAVILVQEGTRKDSFALVQYMARLKVERLFLPFVALNQLCQAYESLLKTSKVRLPVAS